MIPRILLWLALGLGILYVLRPRVAVRQVSGNPNWQKTLPLDGSDPLLDRAPYAGPYRNQPTNAAGPAPENDLIYSAGGWLNDVDAMIRRATGAGQNADGNVNIIARNPFGDRQCVTFPC